MSDIERKREEARRAMLGLPSLEEEEEKARRREEERLATLKKEEEERLKVARGFPVVDELNPEVKQKEPEIVPEPVAPLVDESFYEAKVEELPKEAPKAGDQYREKVSLSDYEVQKAAPIEMQKKQEERRARRIESTTTDTTAIISANATLAHLAAEALDKRAEEKEKVVIEAPKGNKGKKITIILLLVLSILFCILAAARLYQVKGNSITVPIRGTETAVEDIEYINVSSLSKEEVILELKNTKNAPVRVIPLVTEINKTEMILPLNEVVNLFELEPPRPLVQALTGRYAVGNTGMSPFMLLEISSFDYAFAGMFEWESSLPLELGSLFTREFALGEFEDVRRNNIDMRVARDENGKTIIAYAILNTDYIVIAHNEDSLLEVVENPSTLIDQNKLDTEN